MPAQFRVEAQADARPELSSALRKPLYNLLPLASRCGADLLRDFWQGEAGQALGLPAGVTSWEDAALSAGAFGSGCCPTGSAMCLNQGDAAITGTADGLTLVLSPSRMMGDGTQLNNAWLQEAPDPITKVTWDNCVTMGLDTARQIGTGKRELRTNDLIEITVAGQTFRMPVVIVPGMAAGVLETFLGWGRSGPEVGAVATDEPGIDADTLPEKYNAFALAANSDYVLSNVSAKSVGKTYKLAIAQGHQYMDDRKLLLGDVYELYQKDPAFENRYNPHPIWHKDKGTGPVNGVRAPAPMLLRSKARRTRFAVKKQITCRCGVRPMSTKAVAGAWRST